MSNQSYIYGHWRNKPARQSRITGVRETRQDSGNWCPLGMGYCTEFEPFTEELSPDSWEQKHSAYKEPTFSIGR